MNLIRNIILILLLSTTVACTNTNGNEKQKTQNLAGFEKAYFASGCFWCVEAVFESVVGVKEVVSGYSGGEVKNPTYQFISSGHSKHAEAIEVYYDPAKVSYETLLKVFFGSHDPTTVDRQGPDVGPQYRSAIFYQNNKEKELAKAYIKELNASGEYEHKIVTEVVAFKVFYDAEDYHQDYERNNPNNPYIQNVSIPRLKRFQKKFPDLLKENH